MARLTIARSRNILTIVWSIGFIPPLVILGLRTYFGTYYDGKEEEAWGWFTPNIMPTMGLIIATLIADQTGEHGGNKPAPTMLFWLTLLFSILYLSAFNFIFLAEPRLGNAQAPLEMFKRASLFLGVVQGLLTALMGVFFIGKKKDGEERQPEGEEE